MHAQTLVWSVWWGVRSAHIKPTPFELQNNSKGVDFIGEQPHHRKMCDRWVAGAPVIHLLRWMFSYKTHAFRIVLQCVFGKNALENNSKGVGFVGEQQHQKMGDRSTGHPSITHLSMWMFSDKTLRLLHCYPMCLPKNTLDNSSKGVGYVGEQPHRKMDVYIPV